jgi:hypothetical protein
MLDLLFGIKLFERSRPAQKVRPMIDYKLHYEESPNTPKPRTIHTPPVSKSQRVYRLNESQSLHRRGYEKRMD